MRRIDDIGFGDLKLIQETEDFCYGVDAVLLADFVKAPARAKILDLCTGNGIVPLIMHHKYYPEKITGLEFYEGSYRLAVESAELNGLSDKIEFVLEDAINVKKLFKAESFDCVSINPPYTKAESGITSSSDAKLLARHETTASLEDFICGASYVLKMGGSFTIVHRPQRLVDIFTLCRKHRLEPKKLRFVSPYPGKSPNIVLVQCIKDGGAELTVEPDLPVRNEDGSYSEEINKIYERL